MEIKLISETTGELIDTIEIDDTSWEVATKLAELEGITPEEFVRQSLREITEK
jgi:hypothetical protein